LRYRNCKNFVRLGCNTGKKRGKGKEEKNLQGVLKRLGISIRVKKKKIRSHIARISDYLGVNGVVTAIYGTEQGKGP